MGWSHSKISWEPTSPSKDLDIIEDLRAIATMHHATFTEGRIRYYSGENAYVTIWKTGCCVDSSNDRPLLETISKECVELVKDRYGITLSYEVCTPGGR